MWTVGSHFAPSALEALPQSGSVLRSGCSRTRPQTAPTALVLCEGLDFRGRAQRPSSLDVDPSPTTSAQTWIEHSCCRRPSCHWPRKRGGTLPQGGEGVGTPAEGAADGAATPGRLAAIVGRISGRVTGQTPASTTADASLFSQDQQAAIGDIVKKALAESLPAFLARLGPEMPKGRGAIFRRRCVRGRRCAVYISLALATSR